MTLKAAETAHDRAVVRTFSPSRMAYIDALRGVACLWVVLHHTFPYRPGAHSTAYRLLLGSASIGWLGVHLFLVLSGFCLFYPLARKWQGGPISLDLRRFWKKRAQRILPPYYAALALSAGVTAVYQWRHRMPVTGALTGPQAIPMHLLMLQNLHPKVIASVNAVFWSLALETQLYLIFPLLVLAITRYGFRRTLGVVFALSFTWQALVWTQLGFGWDWTPTYAVWYHALPGRCFEFAAGMAAAACIAHPKPGQSRRALLAAGLLLPVGLCYALNISRWGPLCDQVWGVLFACLTVASGSIPDRWFASRMPAAQLAGIGAFSYSIYLVHYPILALLTPNHLHWMIHNEAVSTLVGLLRMLIAVGLGYLFYRAFERPWVRRMQRERDQETPQVAPLRDAA